MHPPIMETTQAASARVGLSTDTLRRLAAQGKIPGAVRLSGSSGPWRIPAAWHPETPNAGVTGSGETGTPATDVAHVTSSSAALTLPARARRVADTLRTVRARPAVALADVLALVADNATGHEAGRDGWCTRCGWQYPCRDVRAAHAILGRAEAVILDGAR